VAREEGGRERQREREREREGERERERGREPEGIVESILRSVEIRNLPRTPLRLLKIALLDKLLC
jgi:hypothetical protein